MLRTFAVVLGVLAMNVSALASNEQGMIVPVIEGEWWRVASNPDLGEYTSDRQEPVDFGLWQAADGTWQLWSCIRNTRYGGHTRVFHGWEGKSITDTDWEPKGIVMESDPALGEVMGGLQAPHVIRHDGRFVMAYGDWTNICFATSDDGKTFERVIQPNGRTGVFSEGEFANARDPMMISINGTWHLYYTAITAGKGYGYCRLSTDLKSWSQSIVVSYGGKLTDNPWFNECPHVIELEPGEFVYFRNQFYGGGNLNWAYYSTNPLNFGIDHDEHLTARLEIAAPEIVMDGDKYYIATLTPELDGIRIARLRWARRAPIGDAFFQLDDPDAEQNWTRAEGNLADAIMIDSDETHDALTKRIIRTAPPKGDSVDDTLAGVLESRPFRLDAPFYTLLVGGGNDRERTYVAIVDANSGEELARYAGRFQPRLQRYRFDATSWQGRSVRVRIVDKSDGPWGHVAFGGIYRQGEPVIFR